MDNMSPQQRQDALSPGGAQQDNKRRTKSLSYRRQSAPSLVLTKALTRSKTLSRESFLLPVCPESCQLVQSFLAGSDRSFLLHGHAQLKTGMQSQDRHLFLFNDIMVIAKAKSANHFKQKAQVCVCEMWTAGCIDEVCEGSINPERCFVMGWPTCNYVATFSSAEQKERWLALLKSRIKEEKEREEPKTIPLRVYGKGINTFAVTKTLPVSNWDSTNEVVRLALQQFSIIGNVKDFQLWVISKRDNTPYPLIGHEFPFSIQMSHVGHCSMSAPADRQRARHVEQMQVYKQCQFIMRPRATDTLNESAEFSQKQFKRRRSLIGWAFWRGSSSHLNEMSLAGAAQGCLYGQPLSSVCVEDTLPKPVMDMLAFLYHEGSWTRGIFRRPAGAKAVRELRDSLDSGECTLPLTTDHAFLIAGVFKDFLRSIPGSLLCCELHEDWIDVLEEDEDDKEQVQDIKRMISRVPKENALLLRYLLAMLHGVQDNAQENQMTTFNLSVCIAPSMLWPPGVPSSPEAEGEGTKKVCELVKFMIEHCREIVGQEPASMFGGPPQRLNADETGSDSWHYPLTDSSYDSLENELDNSSGGSPSFCSTRDLGPKLLQGSLDSILAFSDYDQDTEPETYKSQTDSRPGLKLHRVGGTRRPDLDLHNPRPRRSSEPAVAYAAKFRPYLSGNTGEDEEVLSKPSSHTLTPSLTLHGVRTAAVGPPPNSPAPSLSSLDSESLCSDHTWVTRRGLHPAKTHLHSPVIATPRSAHPPDLGTCPKGSPPKEPISWGTLKGCKGLHPNTWLKKGRRFSLTQQENEEEDHSGGGVIEKSLTLEKVDERGGHSKPKTSCSASKDAGLGGHVRGRPQHLKQDSSPPSHHRSTGSLHFPKAESEGNEMRQPSPSLFYKQSGPSLSLFKQSKSYSVEEEHNSRLYQRRGSEPGWQVVDRASTLTRARLPSDPGLKVTDVDSHGGTSDSRFCLSPHTTKTVKEYFSSHQRSNPQSSQQVALSLVESHREWLKRCSDPKAEPDFDQLLFAEESYV